MCRWLLIALFLVPAAPVAAQEAAFREDLRFVESLRARGDTDLALEMLKRLEAVATPELKKELPLEFAKTRMRLASDESDTAKRLVLYKAAQSDFADFIKANPGHPRVAEANLDIARVLNATGKTELGQALLNPDPVEKKTLSAKARSTLMVANGRLIEAEKALTALRENLPAPDSVEGAAQKKQAQQTINRAEAEIHQTQFEQAMNLFDQAETYLGGSDDLAASKLLEKALNVLDKLAGGSANSAVTWKAKAWQGRIIFQTETAEKARAKFTEVLAATMPAAAEGQRLATYFRMLAIRDKPQPEDTAWKGVTGTGPQARIRLSAENWRRAYPRYAKTPEGYGVAYLLAQVYLGLADRPDKKGPSAKERDTYRNLAKNLLRELESTENEYSDRARQMKLGAMSAQGAFKVDVAKLKTFEDNYIRSQYEAYQISKAKDPDADRKARLPVIMQALRQALAAPDLKKYKGTTEPTSARAMLAFWAIQTGMQKSAAKAGDGDASLEEAARIGEDLIRDDPRSAQAAPTAIYVLQATGALLDSKRGRATEAEVLALRDKITTLTGYIEERWPTEAAGDVARHTIALQLLREQNYAEAIKKLEMLTPTYGNYAVACFQLADAAQRADQEKEKPIPGDREGDYKKRALLALERIPTASLGADPSNNRFVVAGKARLGLQLYSFERFGQMKALADELLPKMDSLKLSENAEQDKAFRDQLRFELTNVSLYARQGLAGAAFRAGDYKSAAEAVDSLVDILSKKGAESPEKATLQKNKQLAMAILVTALKANLQQGLIDRTDLVLQALDEVNEGGGGADVLQMLASLIRSQVDDIRKKGDAAGLAKAIKSYTDLLQRRTKGQARTPDLVRALAGCYSSMDDHVAAAKELKELAAKPGNDKDPVFLALRLTYIRELRLSKDPANLKEARKYIDEAMVDPKTMKTGWGRGNLTALKEAGYLLQDEGKYAEAFALWADLVKRLAKKAREGGPLQEAFLETYHGMVYSMLKMGLAKPSKADRDKAVEQTARQMLTLEESWPSFGGGASEKRFMDLLAQEEAVKQKFQELKAAKAPKK